MRFILTTVNGNWSQWSNWTECSETCSEGIKERNRMCDNPEPQFGGICIGNSAEVEDCILTPQCNSGTIQSSRK